MTITLPFPPSVNNYWRNIVMGGKPRTIMSAKGREYRKLAEVAAATQHTGERLDGRLRVSLELHPPTLRKFDLDNFPKAVLDAVTHAGVWGDDSQVDRLEVLRCPKDKDNPRVVLTITAID